MSNSIAPGSSADVNVKVTALTTNPNVPVTYKTVILKKNLVNGVNTLTQEMMSATNTKYVIKYDYVLGENITIPEGCLLEFDGGAISNGTLVGSNTFLIYNQMLSDIIDNVDLKGTFIHKHTLSVDEEDLTEVDNVIKFKDKAYDPESFSGLGRIYLRKNMVDGVNTLTQEMINTANTIYVIQYDFTLGEDITVPEGCILEFEGGSISGNKTVTGDNTGIQAGLVKIFNANVTLAGTWNVTEAYPEWFGAKGDGVTDDSFAINALLEKTDFNVRLLANKTYCITEAIRIDVKRHTFNGSGGNTIIKVLSAFEDDAVVFYSTDDLWLNRYKQSKIFGNFTLKCESKAYGIRLGGEAGGDYEGAIDQIIVENITIQYALQHAVIIGSHVYKIKVKNINTAGIDYPSYNLTVDENATDNGECTMFEECAFWGSAPVLTRHSIEFHNCTFHCQTFHYGSTLFVYFNSCHFEYLSGVVDTPINGSQFYAYGANVLIENSDTTINVPDETHKKQMEYLAKAENGGSITIDGGAWKWFLARMSVTAETITSGNVMLKNIICSDTQNNWLNLFSKPIYDTTKKNFIPSKISRNRNIEGVADKGYDLFILNQTAQSNFNTKISEPNQNGVITINYENCVGLFTVDKDINIPKDARTIIFRMKGILKNNGTFSANLPQSVVERNPIIYKDSCGNEISDMIANNNVSKTYSKSYNESDTEFSYVLARAIPEGCSSITTQLYHFSTNNTGSFEISEYYVEFI